MEIVVLVAAQAGVLLAAVVVFVALRESRADIEAEVEQLRDELGQLRAAAEGRERAEAASLAKSRFLATVSHEIRTPLNGIMGLAQLVAMTRLDAEQASYIDAIGDSSRSLAQLIDDILDFSKIEAGKLEMCSETFALAPFVESVVELLAPRALAKGLEIASFVSPCAPCATDGDPSRLRQVLVNLIGNAVNYTENGGVGVRLSREGKTLRFEVRDTGPGVADASRQAIFGEFEQGDPSATRRRGGAGLGLAIARRLVTQMGGDLTLAETSGAGSTFSFTLPAPSSAGDLRPRPLAGRRILIVAESQFEAPYLVETLEAAGAVGDITAGEEAILRLSAKASHPFDAVIVDCALGAHTTARVAEAARMAGARRLFLLFSPLERRAFGDAALRDFDGWLVKPVRSASLVRRLSHERSQPSTSFAMEPIPALDDLNALVAEDNDVNALIVMRSLEKLGAASARAHDGAEAVAMATSAIDGATPPYDVIVMDLFMPELDGCEATRRIRMAELRARAPRIPIIALTASAREQDERAARVAGVDAFLTKPVELAALAAAIEELRLPGRDAAGGAYAAYAPRGAMVPNLPDR